MAPPASPFKTQLADLAAAAKARLINFNAEVEKAGLKKKDRQLLKEEETAAIFDRLLPEVKALDSHRLLYGFPKTIAQIHYLRKHKIYPNKLFVVNEDRAASLARIQSKLASEQGLDAQTAATRAAEAYEEYLGYPPAHPGT